MILIHIELFIFPSFYMFKSWIHQWPLIWICDLMFCIPPYAPMLPKSYFDSYIQSCKPRKTYSLNRLELPYIRRTIWLCQMCCILYLWILCEGAFRWPVLDSKPIVIFMDFETRSQCIAIAPQSSLQYLKLGHLEIQTMLYF